MDVSQGVVHVKCSSQKILKVEKLVIVIPLVDAKSSTNVSSFNQENKYSAFEIEDCISHCFSCAKGPWVFYARNQCKIIRLIALFQAIFAVHPAIIVHHDFAA